ncbi:MAG TPA: sigma-70 family RNA polymerase sigma factor [Candidatus Dormibacteraeota bacterium]|nr:sigma-70 family RNA polymerase sigma factor [Candidatus Dormibacteraeota bacterium]
MEHNSGGEVTRLLLQWSGGDSAALEALWPLVYEELRVMAARHLQGERRAHTLQRTALVHEAFLRLVDQNQVDWRGRAQFYGLASQMMRRVLVDHARRRLAQKRGGNAQRVSLDETGAAVGDGAAFPDALALTDNSGVDLGAIDAALKRLESMDPQQGKLVELRFFGGLSIADTATVLGVSAATVKREWAVARAWLQRELTGARV